LIATPGGLNAGRIDNRATRVSREAVVAKPQIIGQEIIVTVEYAGMHYPDRQPVPHFNLLEARP